MSIKSLFVCVSDSNLLLEFQNEALGTPYSGTCLLLLVHRTGEVTYIRLLVQGLTHDEGRPTY